MDIHNPFISHANCVHRATQMASASDTTVRPRDHHSYNDDSPIQQNGHVATDLTNEQKAQLDVKRDRIQAHMEDLQANYFEARRNKCTCHVMCIGRVYLGWDHGIMAMWLM